MDFRPTHCRLCHSMIDPGYLGEGVESWKAEFQLLLLEDGDSGKDTTCLIEPNKLIDTSLSVRIRSVIHRACWSIVERASGKSEFSEEWLKCLVQCMEDMAPFLDRLENPHAPDRLDDDLGDDMGKDGAGTDSEPTPTGDSIFGRFNLPNDIIQYIFMTLDSYQDIISLQHASL